MAEETYTGQMLQQLILGNFILWWNLRDYFIVVNPPPDYHHGNSLLSQRRLQAENRDSKWEGYYINILKEMLV